MEAEPPGDISLDNLKKIRAAVENAGDRREDLKDVIAVAAKMLPDQLEQHLKNIEAEMSGKRSRYGFLLTIVASCLVNIGMTSNKSATM